MRAIGLDIGTTSICAIVLETETGVVLETRNLANDTVLPSANTWEKTQDPNRILKYCTEMIKELTGKYTPVSCIGVTGQMHGIVYLDKDGEALGPLVTWQDERGNLAYQKGQTYAEYVAAQTGCKTATGYGAVTHFYNVKNHLVPENAACFCTIQDFAAMKLAGKRTPLVHTSDAASFGLFDMENGAFDQKALKVLGMDASLFPDAEADFTVLGKTEEGIPVAVAIGDNQASFIGSVSDMEGSVLVNIGTGSQVTVYKEHALSDCEMEIRPCTKDGRLMVGSSLCGGRAYALLEEFFRKTAKMCGFTMDSCYAAMDAYLEEHPVQETEELTVSTLFCGTRENPRLRGSIQGLGIGNFAPEYLMQGVLNGIAGELYEMYRAMMKDEETKLRHLVGSGNGLRKNQPLQKIFGRLFGMPVEIPVHKEEAAYGAALFACVASGVYKTLGEAQKIIRYQDV